MGNFWTLVMFFPVLPPCHPSTLIYRYSSAEGVERLSMVKFQNLSCSSPSLFSYSGAYHPACCELNRNSSNPGWPGWYLFTRLIWSRCSGGGLQPASTAHLTTFGASTRCPDWGWNVLAVKIAIEAGNGQGMTGRIVVAIWMKLPTVQAYQNNHCCFF